MCNEVLVAQETVEALGHTEVTDAAVAPTCTATGLTEGKHCSICNIPIIVQEVLSKAEHTFTVVYELPMWSEKGARIKTCEYCQYEIFDLEIASYSESLYGYHSFSNQINASSMQKLYNDLYGILEKMHLSQEDFSANEIISVSFIPYSLTMEEAVAVWAVFYKENPQFYWINNTLTVSNSSLYISIHEDYYKYEDRRIYNEDIMAMLSECGKLLLNAKTTLEEVKIIHDFIIQRIDYAYIPGTTNPEDALWAHSIIGVSSKGTGVCESYAEAFLFLCELNNIDCILVSGQGGDEDHAWNMVCIDGEWYNVDLTWNDTNKNYAYFGVSETQWVQHHIADKSDGLGMYYLYDLPSACEQEIHMVALYTDNEYMGLYVNIDAAFLAMDDSSKEYVIQLTDDIDCIYKIESETTPAVKKITLMGTMEWMGEYAFVFTNVRIPDKFVLSTNLTIENIGIEIYGTGSLDIQNYILETTGYYCRLGTMWEGFTIDGVHIEMKLCDSQSPSSKILVNTEYQTEFYCIVDVYAVEEGDFSKENNLTDIDGILFREDTVLQNLDAKNVRFIEVHKNSPTVMIKNIVIREDDCYRRGMEIDDANLSVENFEFLYEISIWLRFDSIDNVPDLIFEDIIGEKAHIYFFSQGNDCFLINDVLFTVAEKEDFSLFTCYLSRPNTYGSNTLVESTNLLKCDDNGKVLFYDSENSFLINGTKLCGYIGDQTTILSMPSQIQIIGEKAFIYNRENDSLALRSIYISNNITIIEESAFSNCHKLQSVLFAEESHLTTIGKYAFVHCKSLNSLVIPDSVVSIEYGAFYGCVNLEKLQYAGTIEQWQAISLGECWNFGVPATEVICTDGVITLD